MCVQAFFITRSKYGQCPQLKPHCYINVNTANCITAQTPKKFSLDEHGILYSSRFPNVACELLTSDVSLINDKLGGDESLLEKLYSFLEQDPPLNPLLASFFSKTIGNLIARKTEQVGTEDLICLIRLIRALI